MTEDQFRAIALSMRGNGCSAVEGSHMGNADFRVLENGGKVGRIFATLQFVDNDSDAYGVVMLTPDQQASFIARARAVFMPVKGKWGERGATVVHLQAVKSATATRFVAVALRASWCGKIESKLVPGKKRTS